MNYTDQDQTARNKIRTNTSSNYFVEAGAGSGKTSVLVDRMAAMVENGMNLCNNIYKSCRRRVLCKTL